MHCDTLHTMYPICSKFILPTDLHVIAKTLPI